MTGLGVPGVTPHCTLESLTQKAEPRPGLTKSQLPAAGVYNDSVMTRSRSSLLRCPLVRKMVNQSHHQHQKYRHDNMFNT